MKINNFSLFICVVLAIPLLSCGKENNRNTELDVLITERHQRDESLRQEIAALNEVNPDVMPFVIALSNQFGRDSRTTATTVANFTTVKTPFATFSKGSTINCHTAFLEIFSALKYDSVITDGWDQYPISFVEEGDKCYILTPKLEGQTLPTVKIRKIYK
jgi:hypothetical protein